MKSRETAFLESNALIRPFFSFERLSVQRVFGLYISPLLLTRSHGIPIVSLLVEEHLRPVPQRGQGLVSGCHESEGQPALQV